MPPNPIVTIEQTRRTNSSVAERIAELLSLRNGLLPVWVRAPKGGGVEHYSALSRGKLYQLSGEGLIKSVTLREPGRATGCRLFNLESILRYIAGFEETQGRAEK